MPSIACYILNSHGLNLAHTLAKKMSLQIYAPEKLCMQGEIAFASLPKLIEETFNKHKAHIFICATGIAVRCIAPYLKHKSLDPAVVVCDELGRFAISLLSGHWGGGNALAQNIENQLTLTHNTIAVITTATDVHELPAIDVMAKESECIILDWEKVKNINAAFLRNEEIHLYDPLGLWRTYAKKLSNAGVSVYSHFNKLSLNQPSVGIDWRALPEHALLLRLCIPVLCIGVGCKRGAKKEIILHAIADAMQQANLEPRALMCLASVDIKGDEQGLVHAALELNVPLRLFAAEDLAEVSCTTPSATAAQLFGVERISICEGAALLAAGGENAHLLVEKRKYNHSVTIGIAISEIYMPYLRKR